MSEFDSLKLDIFDRLDMKCCKNNVVDVGFVGSVYFEQKCDSFIYN